MLAGSRPRSRAVASCRCECRQCRAQCIQRNPGSRRSSLPRTSAGTEQDLQGGLEVLKSTDPAVDVLKSELEKARQAAKAPPLDVQISRPKISSGVPRGVRQIRKRSAQTNPSYSRRPQGAFALVGAHPLCRRSSCFNSASHSGRFGPKCRLCSRWSI